MKSIKLILLFSLIFSISADAYSNCPHHSVNKRYWNITRAPVNVVPYLVDEENGISICSDIPYQNLTVEIYDMQNNQVYHEIIPVLHPDEKHNIDFSDFHEGEYCVKIAQGNNYVFYNVTD